MYTYLYAQKKRLPQDSLEAPSRFAMECWKRVSYDPWSMAPTQTPTSISSALPADEGFRPRRNTFDRTLEHATERQKRELYCSKKTIEEDESPMKLPRNTKSERSGRYLGGEWTQEMRPRMDVQHKSTDAVGGPMGGVDVGGQRVGAMVGKCKVWTDIGARNTGSDTTTRGIRYNGRPTVKVGATPCVEVCTGELERSLRASPIHAPSSGLRTVRHNGVFTRRREDDVSEGIILSVVSTQKLRFHVSYENSVSTQMGLRSMQSSLSAGSADGAVAERCSVDDSGSAQYGVHARTVTRLASVVGQHRGHEPCRRCRQATRVTDDASGCHMTRCSNGVDIVDCADHFRRVLSLLDAVRDRETKAGATGDGGYNTQQRRGH
ncbi:hypothetical protein C8R45DRAFT_937238 [Mycena sanguinolenta]|nr:hypothetical protein C8R45DRAFT_937238 [Mycena sanguinolenta]